MARPLTVPLGMDVLTAARLRIADVFDHCAAVYVSFSGGKDSTVLLDLAAAEARRRGRRLGVLFVDLEAQYALTIAHVRASLARVADVADPYWVALPLHLRNAVSQFEPQWVCWEPGREADWVRPRDALPAGAITDEAFFPFFRRAMEFEEFVPAFGAWYGARHAGGGLTACLVGIRAQESLNRWRTLVSPTKARLGRRPWTTWVAAAGGAPLYNAYPIYDWKTEDVWTYHARHPAVPHNRLYDRMHAAGLTIHQQRICQPYGDDQRRGLWLYQVIEPETWGRVVARVAGANQGALYVRERGNVLGNHRVTLPAGHTWQSFARLLLATMPPRTAEHYENKVAVFAQWWAGRGYPDGIPDAVDPADEAARAAPSWRRVCKALLRNDYWCKGLSFSQHKSPAYEKYLTVMKNRRKRWGPLWRFGS